MKRTLFVVEGQTELIFTSKFIDNLITNAPIHIVHTKYHAGEYIKLAAKGSPIEDASHFIQIMNVEGDESVTSWIEEFIFAVKRQGFSAIYGLRDAYTGDNKKMKVNPTALNNWADELTSDHGIDVKITVAIEEVEAWFLAVPSFFLAYNSLLNLEAINSILGFDISNHDIELIAHPSMTIDKVLKSVNLSYKKRLDDAHKIANNLDYSALYFEKASKFSALEKFTQHLNNALP
jgi:hypothetical protein